MKTTHTPGEWVSAFTSNKSRGVRTDSGFICFLPKPFHYPGQDERYEQELEENKANANLIASAPELLDALIEISEGKGRYDMDKYQHARNVIEDMIAIAKNAIKKATE